MNITLSIDEEIVKKVRKIAIDKDTTLTAMVRDYLTSVASGDTATRKADAAKLMQTFEKVSRDMSPRTWTREDLYDRPRRYHGR
jgi:replicative DNA helicase